MKSRGRKRRYTKPPVNICICFWLTSFFVRRSRRAHKYLLTLPTFAQQKPALPSIHAACTSACACLSTAFFSFRGTFNRKYSFLRNSVKEGVWDKMTLWDTLDDWSKLSKYTRKACWVLGSSRSRLISSWGPTMREAAMALAATRRCKC
jgi:hypothetical protein